MRDNFKIVWRVIDCKYTLMRQTFFGWYRFVNCHGERYAEYLMGYDYYVMPDYDTYETKEEASRQIDTILKDESERRLEKFKEQRNSKWITIEKITRKGKGKDKFTRFRRNDS